MSSSGDPDRPNLPIIAVYGTGGTIASSTGEGSLAEPRLTVEGLADAAPELTAGAQLQLVDFCRVPGPGLTAQNLVALVSELAGAAEDGVDGFVVTQGTDTLEEFAFGLDLLWDREEPVVVTGAMRGPDALGADGPVNLLAAVQVASSNQARGAGCLVVLNNEIHAARHVRKTHTTSVAAFASTASGPVGELTEGRVRIWSAVRRPPPLALPSADAPQAPVALVRVALGDDARSLGAIEELGYEGMVVEAMGGGHVPEVFVEPLGRLAARMPVIVVSRVGPGELLRETYGFPGSETELFATGAMSAGRLDGLKARVKLTLALMTGASREQIEAAFEVEGRIGRSDQ